MRRIALILVLLLLRMPASGSTLRVDGLECEHLSNPLGVDVQGPRLSWILHSGRRGEIQTAYRVLVSSSARVLDAGRGDLWDSGRVASDRSVLIAYGGKHLTSRQVCLWKVQIWDRDGRPSGWSGAARWEMGLLAAADWQAKWIGLESGDRPDRVLPARMLRREFGVRSRVRRARAYVSGLGLFELYLNGRKIGDHVLDPALSEYEKRVFYVEYDVTRFLNTGANAVGVVLGNGRYYAPRLTVPTATRTFAYPKLLMQLEIEYADGSIGRVVTDERWHVTADGPIRSNNEYDGEEYDARKNMRGWCVPGYSSRGAVRPGGWQPVQIVAGPGGTLRSQMSPPIRVTQTVRPVSMRRASSGAWLFDMGQNIVGWCRLRVSGPRGATVTLRHSETLNKDRSLYVANLRSARATDTYTLASAGSETWEPRFTYHGFRYVEITGFPGTPTLGSIDGRVVHDDLAESGSFSCGSELVNRIWRNIRWGMRGNYRSVPTDCPQRDERQGWLGDRSAESRGETYLFDACTFYSRWLDDIRDSQRADGSIPDVAPTYWPLYNDDVTWPSTFIIIPGVLYDQYGDAGAVRANYPAMKRWAGYMQRYLVDGLMPRDSYGDWCVPPESPELIHSKDPARRTDGTLIATAYYWYDLKLLASYAQLAGRPSDAPEFDALADRIKAAFNRRFFNTEQNLYDNGSQTSSLLPLAFGLAPPGREPAVFANLVRKIEGNLGPGFRPRPDLRPRPQIGVGLLGCQWLMHALSKRGRSDLAWSLVTREEYPSWGYMVRKGATTVWELWNGDTADPAMNSLNHVMLVGDLLTWLYEDVAGIAPDSARPGFRHILMHPRNVTEIGHARATHRSPYGLIVSDWRVQEGKLVWDIQIPANSSATLWVPALSPSIVSEGGRPASTARGVRVLRTEPGTVVFEAGSGRYRFVSRVSPKPEAGH